MLQLTVKAKSPIAMSKHPMVAGRPTETHDYITGSALRGAMAAEYLRRNPVNEEFKEFFESGKVKWGNLYPVNNLAPSMPLPATALSCKRHPGFVTEKEDHMGERPHGVKDCLINYIASEYSHEKCGLLVDSKPCEFNTERYRGFYQKDDGLKTVKVKKRLETHTAIDPETLSAKHEALFTLQVIGEGQEFIGFVDMDNDGLENRIRKFLDKNRNIFVGNDRSRGLGAIEISDHQQISLAESSAIKSVENRVTEFQRTIEGVCPDGYGFFTVFLYSDAIVMDNFLCYQTFIDKAVLDHSLKGIMSLPEGIELKRGYANIYLVSGWNAVGRLPKRADMAINKGSVFLFSYPKAKENEVIQCLKIIEDRGIGERQTEGFGRIIICNPFHQEVNQNERE